MRALTERQAAVLAALSRYESVRLPWFAWEDFPELSQSTVLRVLDALEKRGLIYTVVRDERLVYGGGVEWRLSK